LLVSLFVTGTCSGINVLISERTGTESLYIPVQLSAKISNHLAAENIAICNVAKNVEVTVPFLNVIDLLFAQLVLAYRERIWQIPWGEHGRRYNLLGIFITPALYNSWVYSSIRASECVHRRRSTNISDFGLWIKIKIPTCLYLCLSHDLSKHNPGTLLQLDLPLHSIDLGLHFSELLSSMSRSGSAVTFGLLQLSLHEAELPIKDNQRQSANKKGSNGKNDANSAPKESLGFESTKGIIFKNPYKYFFGFITLIFGLFTSRLTCDLFLGSSNDNWRGRWVNGLSFSSWSRVYLASLLLFSSVGLICHGVITFSKLAAIFAPMCGAR